MPLKGKSSEPGARGRRIAQLCRVLRDSLLCHLHPRNRHDREVEVVVTVGTSSAQQSARLPPLHLRPGQSVAVTVLAALRPPSAAADHAPPPPEPPGWTVELPLPDGRVGMDTILETATQEEDEAS